MNLDSTVDRVAGANLVAPSPLIRWLYIPWVTILALACLPMAMAEPLPARITGELFEYTVKTGDYLTKIGARFGVTPTLLATANELKYDARLKPGQILKIENRHIVPASLADGLLINLPQRMLFFFRAGKLVMAYPVGLGKPDWRTPAGKFSVVEKVFNKTWLVPKSIQEEMRRKGKLVMTEVPPGPDNPLGKYWIGLSIPAIGIHGTIAPASIFHFQSHGCIRLHPDDIEALFAQVERGTTGRIIYVPLLLTEAGGRVFIEAHRDSYHLGDASLDTLEQMALDAGLSDHINWKLAAEVLKLREGVARDVTRSPDAQ